MSDADPRMEKQLVVRCSDELKEWLERDAYDHGRTVAQSVRFYLTIAWYEQLKKKLEEEGG